MSEASAIIDAIDRLAPGYHPLTVAMMLFVVPALLWLIGFRWQWREDRRRTDQSVVMLAMQLVGQQRAELGRLVGEGQALRGQLDLFTAGRYRLQDAVDALREQLIAARMMTHEYERRLGLPETAFPPMPVPNFIERAAVSNPPESPLSPA